MSKIGLLPRLIIAITLGILIGAVSPEWIVKLLATFNSIFGSFLGFIIPLIIIGFVAPGIGALGKGAGKLLGLTTGIAYLSTIVAGVLAFLVGSSLFPSFLAEGSLSMKAKNPEDALVGPFFELEIPEIMGVMSALVFAFLIGIGLAVIQGDTIKRFMGEFQLIIEKVITAVIIPLLPIHILGIFTNMTYTGQVATILSVFAKVFAVIISLHLCYLVVLYLIGGTMAGGNPFKLMKMMAPAYFTALGTQSSAATIPVTLRQIKKTGVNEGIAEFGIPLLATIHLSGSTITIVSCAMAVMLLNDMPFTLSSMIPVILMLGITMVAAPGVPGGAIMAALGVLQTMLGFNETLLSLMIALYLAQDSFGTAANVTGDGALTLMLNKMNKHGLKQAG
ncbi:sodium:proton antiporter [Kroppenstedtia guangzhouensis]|uniref:Sodium:proton antiporter n=1 Tax=Kroppenstedtia guangzhouensis TaxID=1274356 RepID=A0ABQ1GR98_9BACL|nr:dicarboxylate/amino acid:cation symporter [Kroppenstedtia guangzhouensis]GGA48509.1 sodium:proton antiporter [Kroppenstedtia guangzhouensis]